MNDYSSSTTFEFIVERYKTLQGIYIEEKDLPMNFDTNHYEYVTIPLQIKGRSYFRSGNFSGLPENCFPDESDAEIISVLDSNENDWSDKLSASEEDSIISMIAENHSSDEYDDHDDDYDESLSDYERDDVFF